MSGFMNPIPTPPPTNPVTKYIMKKKNNLVMKKTAYTFGVM